MRFGLGLEKKTGLTFLSLIKDRCFLLFSKTHKYSLLLKVLHHGKDLLLRGEGKIGEGRETERREGGREGRKKEGRRERERKGKRKSNFRNLHLYI